MEVIIDSMDLYEFEQTQGDSEGQGTLVCCSPWSHKELDRTERVNNNCGKECACNAGYAVLIPRLGRSSVEGNGYPIQYSCLGNPTDRAGWQAIVHGVAAESDAT